MNRNDLLIRKVNQYKGLIRDAANRYKVPGKIDEEEISQECLILINELLDQYPDCDPESEGFTSLLKTALYRRVISLVRPYLSQRRDYHKERHGSADDDAASSIFDTLDPSSVTNPPEFYWAYSPADPSQSAEYTELVENISGSLDSDTLRLFEYLAHQPHDVTVKLKEYNDNVWTWGNGEVRTMKTRCHNLLNQEFIAYYFGWTKQKVRYRLRTIKNKVSHLTGTTA